MDIKKRLKELEHRIELLEKRGPQGTRLKEMADWIMELFEDEKSIRIDSIMKKGKRMGYSSQMLGRARRTYLSDVIQPVVGSKKYGWAWERVDG